MTTREELLRAIEQLPDDLVEQVLNFLLFKRSQLAQTQTEAAQPTAEVSEEELVKANLAFLEFAQELVADLPPEVLEQLPRDGATNHDHYLYGAPKREE
jgi:hypothetical protein